MDYQKYFLEIVDFISSYEDILLREPLDNFKERQKYYPQEFINQLRNKSDEQHYRFIHFHDHSEYDQNLVNFQLTVKDLSERFAFHMRESKALPSWALWKVGQKKQHEIEQITSLISEDIKPKSVVDIGGGIGHLARTLAHYFGIPTTSIDLNKDFQELGKKRLEKYPLPEGAAPVKFHHGAFNKELLKEIDYDLSLGLHTCGPLAVEHMNGHQKPLINFGCCYHKLDASTYPLSNFGKEKLPFTFTNEAYTLATRSHYGADEGQFYKTKKVKDYRFTLQYLFEEDYGIQDFFSVGSSVNSTYKSSFADYAIERLNFLDMEVKRTPEQLNAFFNDPSIKKKVREIYLCNIIRWRFGRLLELLIILDRGIWLQEQGVNVEIKALFDPSISPRNLALITK